MGTASRAITDRDLTEAMEDVVDVTKALVKQREDALIAATGKALGQTNAALRQGDAALEWRIAALEAAWQRAGIGPSLEPPAEAKAFRVRLGRVTTKDARVSA